MDTYDQVDSIRDAIREYNRDWDRVEAKYKELVRKRASSEIADEIAEIDLDEYAESLEYSLKRALSEREGEEVKVIYLHFDIDNDWCGNLFLCSEYEPESEETDGWVGSDVAMFDSGECPDLTRAYCEYGGWDEGEDATAVTAYLVARSVALFGRICEKLVPRDLPVCMGHHDQDVQFRIREQYDMAKKSRGKARKLVRKAAKTKAKSHDTAKKTRGAEALKLIRKAAKTKAKSLDLSDLSYSDGPDCPGLKTLPDELWELSHLEELNLTDIEFGKLPPGIGQLTNLKELRVEACKLRALPPEIGRLAKLKRLNASQNSIKELPPEIGELKKLRELDLEDNKLTALPAEIGDLSALTQADFGYNKLTALPKEIGKLAKLKSLNLGESKLIDLPDEMADLPKLEGLFVFNASFTELPRVICEIRSLEELHIGDNKLKTLPAELKQLTSLRTLHLADNPMGKLPAVIGKLRNLEELDAGNCKLTSVGPEIVKLTALKGLYLSSNRLTALPKQIARMKNLEILNVGDNELTSIPPEIAKLTALRELELFNNRLTSLPEEIVTMNNLNVLSISRNKIKSLSPALKAFMMDIYDQIDAMRPFIANHDWDGLEARYRKLASEYASPAIAEEISSIGLNGYAESIESGLKKAVSSLNGKKAKAIYCEFDMDEDWATSISLCGEYAPESERDDEWACENVGVFDGGSCRALQRVYDEYGAWVEDKDKVTATTYLIARTVAIFGRTCEKVKPKVLAVCIGGYDDQAPVFRIQE